MPTEVNVFLHKPTIIVEEFIWSLVFQCHKLLCRIMPIVLICAEDSLNTKISLDPQQYIYESTTINAGHL